jgi:penicillin G amidase
MKRALRIIGVCGVLSAVALAAGWTWLRQALPQTTGEVEVPGLSRALDVMRDAHGIPHVYAASSEDAYFALGYAHAQDRLWQMELGRRVASGTLSELLGERGLETDRLFRTLGLARHARANYAQLDASARPLLEAYARGVNAWLGGEQALPLELRVLAATPRPWAPSDSLLLVKLLAWQLSGNWGAELRRVRLASKLTLDELAEFTAPHPGNEPLDLARLFQVYARLELSVAPRAEQCRGALDLAPAARALARFAPGRHGHAVGSNNWAVSGARSLTGAPLLANDPHLELRVPSQWYFAHLDAPGLSAIGASLPGVPGIILGRNDSVAWAFTNTFPDTQDLFLEKLAPGQDGHYLTPAGPQPFERTLETIAVRGGDDVQLLVRHTRHGPVLSDVDDDARRLLPAGHVLALSWTGFAEDDQTASFPLRAALATDAASFLQAARSFHAPQQNVTYADRAGVIGFVAAGRVPVRKPDNELAGLVPAPGWLEAYDWQGLLPFEELPQLAQPPLGQIVTANQRITPPGYAHWLGADWGPPYRAQRIGALLEQTSQHSLSSFRHIQLDQHSTVAARVLPPLLALLPRPAPAAEALALLEAWDLQMGLAAPEPLIFSAWLRELSRELYADELEELFDDEWVEQPEFLRNVLTRDAQAHWCDNRGSAEVESCPIVVARAWSRAIRYLSERLGSEPRAWSWGDVHVAVARHPLFGQLPLLSRWFNLVNARGGDSSTVDVGSFWMDEEESAFQNDWGPSFRALYDLADLERSVAISNSGQSAHVLSPHYRDMNQLWASGQHVPLITRRESVSAVAQGTLQLRPAKSN